MQPTKQGRAIGRVLFFGIHPEGRVLSWLAPPHSKIASEVLDTPSVEITSIFSQLLDSSKSQSSKSLLITELRRIHQSGYISGKKLGQHGLLQNYNAPNSGGYTLEAELGVISNSFADPDFHGWEVKQFAVKRFGRCASKPQTLITPQPDGGIYFDKGITSFIKIYGYKDKKRADRYNFNGRHFYNVRQNKTGLTFIIEGFNDETGKIVNVDGYVALIDSAGTIAASWSFAKLLWHWKKKHNKAVYIQCLKDRSGTTPAYHYGNVIELYSGTTFEHFLRAIAHHHIYLDPGARVNDISTKPAAKHRCQFRVKHGDLSMLYEEKEEVDVLLPLQGL
ncbi:MvaI/BcnI restriction endonuclease family protein [Endozoicomonas sp. ONNA2]|uniref:MvaI/BcnI restriction endonuclease family protein n=1 Tax=Endozoicomonas sp. ONNA2 TaxID=2828741 RepID=UPI00214972DE|nr:MvaI/BcnI restriction endonuclease family protein [Endozoicomonas sp. ONNA2]